MEYEKEKQIALRAVLQAARLCTAVRAELVDTGSIEKGDKSPVTVADFGAQALICQGLKSAFPDDAIVAEENADQLRAPQNAEKLAQVTHFVRYFRPEASPRQICEWIDKGNDALAERFWTLDPIDGTKGFLRDDQYAIALALVHNRRVQLSVLACPALPLILDDPLGPIGTLFLAVRGNGTLMTNIEGEQPAPIHVNHGRAQEGYRLVESVESAHGNHALQEAIARTIGLTQPPLRIDSQAKYGAVARGDAVLYLRLPSDPSSGYREKIWDHAAGSLIVEEAGGKVTDMHGHALDLSSDRRMRNNQGVIVSNGNLHETTLRALNRRDAAE
jgi:3'(2'), 5'-bisphosphate nucleotidase